MKLCEIFKNNGTYAGVRFSEDTKNKIKKFIEDNNIINPVDINTLHTTLLYSKKYLPKYKSMGEIYPPWIGKPEKLKIWENYEKTKNILVLIFKCKELSKRHNYLMKEHKATYDFPQYISHITLSYDIGDLNIDNLYNINNYLKQIEIIHEYKETLSP